MQRAADFLPKYASYFAVHKMSPLAVLARCRENYSCKTWDEGAFELYDPVLQESIAQEQRYTKKRDLQRIRALVDVYSQEENTGIMHCCLQADPMKNRIQAWTTLTFTHLKCLQEVSNAQLRRTSPQDSVQLPAEFSAMANFSYDAAPGSPYPDACTYLSSFLQNSNVRKCHNENAEEIATANASGFSVANRNDACTVGQSTLAFEQSIQTNIIDKFCVSNNVLYDSPNIAAVNANVQAKYNAVVRCTAAYTTVVELEILVNIRKIVDDLDLTLTTGEGDLLHQFVDCIFIGTQTKAILAPADTSETMENIMYWRQQNGSSRRFELPCVGTYVYDRQDGANTEPFLQKSCGRDTRISIMAYVTRSIVNADNGGLHARVSSLIAEKVKSIIT